MNSPNNSALNQSNSSGTTRKPTGRRPIAYIVTAGCGSARFTATKNNVERVFPNYFDIVCYLFVPLTDPRIHPVPLSLLKRFSSNLLTFIDLWTYVIPNRSNTNELEWSFIFEDDVNFYDPSKISLPNYISALEEFMYNPEIQIKHGFFYLGICGPTLINDTQPLISKHSNNSLQSRKGCGFCLHASAVTTNRSRLLWTEISSYRPNIDGSLDKQMQDFCVRSKSSFYTLGTNLHYPPATGHYGIAYQDRGRFSTTVL